jgi:hypothetical protein
VDSISVKTSIDHFGNLDKVFDRILGYNDVHGCEGLFLVEAPDVEFMD